MNSAEALQALYSTFPLEEQDPAEAARRYRMYARAIQGMPTVDYGAALLPNRSYPVMAADKPDRGSQFAAADEMMAEMMEPRNVSPIRALKMPEGGTLHTNLVLPGEDVGSGGISGQPDFEEYMRNPSAAQPIMRSPNIAPKDAQLQSYKRAGLLTGNEAWNIENPKQSFASHNEGIQKIRVQGPDGKFVEKEMIRHRRDDGTVFYSELEPSQRPENRQAASDEDKKKLSMKAFENGVDQLRKINDDYKQLFMSRNPNTGVPVKMEDFYVPGTNEFEAKRKLDIAAAAIIQGLRDMAPEYFEYIKPAFKDIPQEMLAFDAKGAPSMQEMPKPGVQSWGDKAWDMSLIGKEPGTPPPSATNQPPGAQKQGVPPGYVPVSPSSGKTYYLPPVPERITERAKNKDKPLQWKGWETGFRRE